MNAPLYTTEILRLAASLPEPLDLELCDGAAEVRSPTCGSVIRTEITLKDGLIEAISQQVQACAFGQASAALLAAGAVGRSRADIDQGLADMTAWLGGGEIPHWPSAGALSPAQGRKGRHGAILLPFRALIAAMNAAE